MTQPVQEPSQGRVNQGLEFRTRQLFRRPGSTDLCVPVRDSDCAESVLSFNPKAYWQLQDCYQATTPFPGSDSSGNGLNLDQVGAVMQRQPGPLIAMNDCSFGETYPDNPQLIGINQSLTTVVNNFTMVGWVKVAFATGRPGNTGTNAFWTVGNNVGTAKGWTVEIDASTRKFRYVASGVGNGAASAATLVDGGWYHIAVVRDSGTWIYYLNGNIDTASAGSHAPGVPLTYAFLHVGNCVTNQAHFAFYESALSDTDISDLKWRTNL